MKYGKHLSPSQVAEIKENLWYRKISQELDVSYTRVANLLEGRHLAAEKRDGAGKNFYRTARKGL